MIIGAWLVLSFYVNSDVIKLVLCVLHFVDGSIVTITHSSVHAASVMAHDVEVYPC